MGPTGGSWEGPMKIARDHPVTMDLPSKSAAGRSGSSSGRRFPGAADNNGGSNGGSNG